MPGRRDRRRFLPLILVTAMAGGMAGCAGLTLDPGATSPPDPRSVSSVRVPAEAARPTPFDGAWSGTMIAEQMQFLTGCSGPLSTYSQIGLTVKNGIVTSVDHPYGILLAEGWVNGNGVFLVSGSGAQDMSVLFRGTIRGDRLTGRWEEGSAICYGWMEMVRDGPGPRYCIAREGSAAYVSKGDCRGIDRRLTRDEFDILSRGKG